MNGKKNFAAAFSLNRIQFYERIVRMGMHKCFKIFIGTVYAAGFIHLYMNSLFPGTVSYFSGKIKIHSGKDAGINKTINSSFTDHNGIPVSGTDMMRGLSLFYKGSNEVI